MFKKSILKIQDGGRPPVLRNIKCDISATIRPLLMKFGMMMHLSPRNLMANQKFQNPRMVKFGTAMHIRPPNLTDNQKFKNLQIQDGGQRPS